MKILTEFISRDFDIAIFGLGFESRSTSTIDTYINQSKKNIVLGYDVNTEKFSYQNNKERFEKLLAKVYETGDEKISSIIQSELHEIPTTPLKVLVDITVMSRHRLAIVMCELFDNLPKGSIISVVYSISSFVTPPEDNTPIKYVREISPQLSGSLGDLSLPTSVVLGLGYEQNKALGVSNLLDAGFMYAFIPESPVGQFKEQVLNNNSDLLMTIPKDNIFYYDVCSPYSTYLSLRSLILAVREHSRPLLVPLGPKILSSLSVFLGLELRPELPVWRVSSGHAEIPVDRPPSGIESHYSIKL